MLGRFIQGLTQALIGMTFAIHWYPVWERLVFLKFRLQPSPDIL